MLNKEVSPTPNSLFQIPVTKTTQQRPPVNTHHRHSSRRQPSTLGLKFDYRRAASNLINFQAIFRHSTGIRRKYHFLAIFRQSDRDPTNVVVFLLHYQCTPKMATLQCTPYLPTWILRVSVRQTQLQQLPQKRPHQSSVLCVSHGPQGLWISRPTSLRTGPKSLSVRIFQAPKLLHNPLASLELHQL